MWIEKEGSVEEIIYTNEVNGYTVCELLCGDETVTAVGYLPFVHLGETIHVSGRWVTHPEYGEQLKVETFEKRMPASTEALERYLASGVIKGIGPATARKIIDHFQEETMNVIQFRPERLSEIKGISLDKAFRIGQAFQEQQGLREVILFLQKHGIGPSYATRLYKVFGERTVEEIRNNPFKLADEVFGIGFKTADRIARSLGIDPMSKFRVRSGIKHVLSQAVANGHTYLPEDKLTDYTSQLLEVELNSIQDALVSLQLDKSVWVERIEGGSRAYLAAFHQSEVNVSRRLYELSRLCEPIPIRNIDKRMREIEREEGITLAQNQRIAVQEALTNGVLVITGGPGTGKTTLIKSIIRLLYRENFKVVLAAPTGRAAKRMSEATGYEAKTIHRMLEMGYSESDTEMIFGKDEENPLEADVVIIDEMSMVDILLMNSLVKALKPGTRLILCGDADQLPSVGAGNVLRDIIQSECVHAVRLTEIFRQAAESMIIVNAHRINAGDTPILNQKDRDFFFLPRRTAEEALATVVDLCIRRLPASYGYNPLTDIQVLAPSRKGTVGVNHLNISLQKALNPAAKHKNERLFGDFTFREGDRVMQVRNNYNLQWFRENGSQQEGEGVFNGDTGIIVKIDEDEQKLQVSFEDEKTVDYDFSMLDELEPAYAMTIHKGQGSEFKALIIPIFQGPSILMTRNLLYTGVTRAKELVILVGSEATMIEMIQNKKEALRYSNLTEKLRALNPSLSSSCDQIQFFQSPT